MPTANGNDEQGKDLDEIVDAFEQEWRASNSPRIETFAAQARSEDFTQCLQALIETELELRHSKEQSPSRDEYETRFPEHLPEVNKAFAAFAERCLHETLDATVLGTVHSEPIETRLAQPGEMIDETLSFIVTAQSGVLNSTKPTLDERLGPGTVVDGRYRLIRQLGEGGMGTVMLGEDNRLGRAVAVKFIRVDYWDTAKRRYLESEFENEAKLGASLKHPSIATVYDYGFEGNTPYTIFEQVEGESLTERIAREAPMHIDDVREIVGRLAMALDYAHEKGIVHRDLKPDNIRFDEYGTPKILDFGLAKDFRTHSDWHFAGTPAYASPEQAREEPSDGRTDQYALALIAFEMLFGRRPFAAANWMEMLTHQRETPVKWGELEFAAGAAVKHSVLKALSKDANTRYPNCLAFAIAIGCDVTVTQSQIAEFSKSSVVSLYTKGLSGKLILNRTAIVAKSEGYTWIVNNEEIRRFRDSSFKYITIRGRKLEFCPVVASYDRFWLKFSNREEAQAWNNLLGVKNIEQSEERDEVDSPSPINYPVVVAKPAHGNVRMLGSCEATAVSRSAAQLTLQLKAASMGANAVFSATLSKMVGETDTLFHANGVAGKTLDTQSRASIVADGYGARMRSLTFIGLGVTLGVLLLRLVGAAMLRPKGVEFGDAAIFACCLAVIPMVLGLTFLVTRWAQLFIPFVAAVFLHLTHELFLSVMGIWHVVSGGAELKPQMLAAVDPVYLGLVFAAFFSLKKSLEIRRLLQLHSPKVPLSSRRKTARFTARLLTSAYGVAIVASALWGSRYFVNGEELATSQALLSHGESKRAKDILLGALKKGPDAAVLINLSNAELDLGNPTDAVKYASQAIDLAPDESLAYINRGVARVRLGALSTAVQDFDRAIELDHGSSLAFANRAACHFDLGEPELCLRDCEAALDIDPRNGIAFALRGGVALLAGEYELALADCERAISINAAISLPFAIRGGALHDLGRFEEARDSFLKAIRLGDKRPELHSLLGRCCLELAEFDQCVKYCTIAIDSGHRNALTFLSRSAAYEALGKEQGAESDRRMANRLLRETPAEAESNRP